MKVAMVKHHKNGKTFWFEVPKELEGQIEDGVCVVCDTVRGKQPGFVVGRPLDSDSVRDIMEKSGAAFPLRMTLSVKSTDAAKPVDVTLRKIPMEKIKVPGYLLSSKPGNSKIAKRFMEYYHTGGFRTRVIVTGRGVLKDGYTAYLAAKTLRLPSLLAEVEADDEEKTGGKTEGHDYKIPEDIKSVIPDYFYDAFGGELVSVFGVNVLNKNKDGEYGLAFLGSTAGYVEAFRATCKKLGMDWLADYYDALPWRESDLFDGEISDEVLKQFDSRKDGLSPYYTHLLSASKG